VVMRAFCKVNDHRLMLIESRRPSFPTQKTIQQ
jgi:hypothetical protein